MLNSFQTDIYIAAIVSGETKKLLQILSPDIEAFSPTSPQVITDKISIIKGLGSVSRIVTGLKLVRVYQAEENWHLSVFRGHVNGEDIMFTDQNCILIDPA